jgi:hypothetical protein
VARARQNRRYVWIDDQVCAVSGAGGAPVVPRSSGLSTYVTPPTSGLVRDRANSAAGGGNQAGRLLERRQVIDDGTGTPSCFV